VPVLIVVLEPAFWALELGLRGLGVPAPHGRGYSLAGLRPWVNRTRQKLSRRERYCPNRRRYIIVFMETMTSLGYS